MADPHSEHEQHDEHDDGAVHAHSASVGFYSTILGILMALTVLTVAVASIHLGALNLAVAVVIATIKASLVVLFFMHLKDDSRFNALVFVGALLFAGVFLAYTMNDTGRRAQVEDVQGGYVDPSTGEVAPGGIPGGPALRTDIGEASEEAAEHEEQAAPAATEHHEEEH